MLIFFFVLSVFFFVGFASGLVGPHRGYDGGLQYPQDGLPLDAVGEGPRPLGVALYADEPVALLEPLGKEVVGVVLVVHQLDAPAVLGHEHVDVAVEGGCDPTWP